MLTIRSIALRLADLLSSGDWHAGQRFDQKAKKRINVKIPLWPGPGGVIDYDFR
jgi:hypothetical protein